jgi:hypothetical protein
MNTQTSGEAAAHLLTLVRHKHVARRFAVLEHVSGSCIEQRKEDVVRAEHQTLVLQRTRVRTMQAKSRGFFAVDGEGHTLAKAKRQALTSPLVTDWHCMPAFPIGTGRALEWYSAWISGDGTSGLSHPLHSLLSMILAKVLSHSLSEAAASGGSA